MRQVPGLSQEQQVLALAYTAEALCHMQGAEQAAQQLQKAVVLQGVSSNGTHRPSDAEVGNEVRIHELISLLVSAHTSCSVSTQTK